jgi:exopolysaccharide production protein ExoZ
MGKARIDSSSDICEVEKMTIIQRSLSSPAHQSQLIYIQILRFFAATSVLLFHSINTGRDYLIGQNTIFFRYFTHGDLGVDLFFVISGFIIYQSTHQANMSATEFMHRRIERILPIYWLVTICVFLLAMLLPGLFKSVEGLDPEHLLKSLLFI